MAYEKQVEQGEEHLSEAEWVAKTYLTNLGFEVQEVPCTSEKTADFLVNGDVPPYVVEVKSRFLDLESLLTSLSRSTKRGMQMSKVGSAMHGNSAELWTKTMSGSGLFGFRLKDHSALSLKLSESTTLSMASATCGT